jgi:F0F1-type ATP synthase assembly protein I
MAADHAHNGEIPMDSPAGVAPGGVSAATATPAGQAAVRSSDVSDRVAARTRQTMRSLRMSSVGIELSISVLLGMFGGRWVDNRLGTTPWLMLLGLTIGFTAGLRSVMRAMDRASRTESEP